MANTFQKLVQDSAAALAEFVAHEEVDEKKLIHPQAKQKKMQHEIEHAVQAQQKKMHDGLQACIGALRECHDLPMTVDQVVEELLVCIGRISSPEDLTSVGDALLSNTSWKKYLQISNACMETLYQGAKSLFEKRDFASSEKAFFVLCSLDPMQYAYWVGLGHSAFHQKNYDEALLGYSMASTFDRTSVWPHIWAANSFEEQKDFAHAKMALQEALSLEKMRSVQNQELIHALESRVQKLA